MNITRIGSIASIAGIAGITRRSFVAGLAGPALWPCAAAARNASAPAVLLAGVADDTIDPSPYLVSEKYDGARAVWDGVALRFRSGRIVPAPAWFTGRLPKQPLDGELWLARQRFDALSGLVRKTEPVDAEWQQLHYMVFELPGGAGDFAQRYKRLGEVIRAAQWPALQLVEQRRIADRAGLRAAFADVVGAGGEGLVLHRADAGYQTGRSQVLLKLKTLRDDEAVVLARVPGKGKYAGMMGALDVRIADGRRFRLGTGFSDEQRRDPPALGATVTFAYRDLTPTGLPRFASFLRVRDEL